MRRLPRSVREIHQIPWKASPFFLLIGYIDGAVTGQFSDLPITAMKIALGIHKRKTPGKEMAWRTLGYVPQISTHASRGKALMHESGHSEAEHLYVSDGGGKEDMTNDTCKAQDFHTMLSLLLSSFDDVQKNDSFGTFVSVEKPTRTSSLCPP